MDIAKAVENQLKNIETRSGKSIAELRAILRDSGKSKHGELVSYLKGTLGMGHGDANAVVKHHLSEEQGGPKEGDDALSEIYTGPKAGLRPLHDKLLAQIESWGSFEVAPKKGYVSLRRAKQFAMVGPATAKQIEVGLNMKGAEGTERLKAQPAGGMCSHKVRIAAESELDGELLGWIRAAFDAAG